MCIYLCVLQVPNRYQRFIDGFHVQYRKRNRGSGGGSSNRGDYTRETVTGSAVSTYTIRNLEEYTWYEIRVAPFYERIEGANSDQVSVLTLEDGTYSARVHFC